MTVLSLMCQSVQIWNIKPACCLFLAQCLLDISLTLKMEALCSSEVSVNFYCTIWCHILKHSILHVHCCEDIRPAIIHKLTSNFWHWLILTLGDILFQLVTVYYTHIITVHLLFNILLQNWLVPKDQFYNTDLSAKELKIIFLKIWIQYLHTSINIYL